MAKAADEKNAGIRDSSSDYRLEDADILRLPVAVHFASRLALQ